MTEYHPTDNVLRDFSLGKLDDVLTAMVGAHLGFCDQCRQQVRQLDAVEAEVIFNGDQSVATNEASQGQVQSVSETNLAIDIDALVEDLVEDVVSQPAAVETQPARKTLTMNVQGRAIEVPAVLSGIVERSGAWNHVMGEVWQSPVARHGLGYQIDFIYMEAGGSIPKHTHKGREITIILEGSFADEQGKYFAGDFLVRSEADEHVPVATRGCLCLAVIDAPLHFTSGVARLLNPFSSLFFRSEA